MSKKYDPGWETALTVVQEVQPPFIPEGAHAMTVVIDYPPGSAGAPPHRHPSGPAFGYMLEGEMLFELEGEPPRVIQAGEAFWEPGGDVIHYSDGNNRDDMRCRFTVTMLCVPGKPMLELVTDDELKRREHLRVQRNPAPQVRGYRKLGWGRPGLRHQRAPSPVSVTARRPKIACNKQLSLPARRRDACVQRGESIGHRAPLASATSSK